MKIVIDKSNVNKGNSFFTGIALIIIGIIILYGKSEFLNLVMKFIATGFIITGISKIVSRIIRKKDDIENNVIIGQAILNLILGMTMIYLNNVSLSLLPMAFGIYLILNGIVKLITIYIYIKNKISIKLVTIIECLIYFVFGTTTFFNPLINLDMVLMIIGIYLFMFGINLIKNLIKEVLPENIKKKLKRKARITLPVFLALSIPHRVLKKINEDFKPASNLINKIDTKYNGLKVILDSGNKIEINNTSDVDLEIFIHVTSNGIGVVGHMDLYFNKEIISYGNYDESSYKLFGVVGEGTLFSCDKDKYIEFCTNYGKKTLFSYGLKLNDEQKKIIEKNINEIKENLVEWKPGAATVKDKDQIDEYQDYASVLFKSTGARFFKFKGGKFKTYFGGNTNCVLLADCIICNSGVDILNKGGVITPGTYYAYLKSEFAKENSIVVSNTIHR